MTETSTGTEVVPASEETESRIETYLGYDPNLDFRKLALEAQYYTKGFRLVDKVDLIGVPHVVIGVTYREGFPRKDKPGDYVSVEAVVGDAATLASNPVKHSLPGELNVFANECVVYNDAGTGIRRYLTELFHHTGIINVGKFDPAKIMAEDNPYDRAYQHWSDGADRATTGIVADNDGVAFRLVVMRGLRRSDYEWQGQPATTYYLS